MSYPLDIDADTVDGKHAEDHPMPQEGLIQVGTYGVTYQALDITGFDWDTMTVSGVYHATSPTNAPYDDDWYLEVVRALDQTAYNLYMPEEVYYRLYDGGVWGSCNSGDSVFISFPWYFYDAYPLLQHVPSLVITDLGDGIDILPEMRKSKDFVTNSYGSEIH